MKLKKKQRDKHKLKMKRICNISCKIGLKCVKMVRRDFIMIKRTVYKKGSLKVNLFLPRSIKAKHKGKTFRNTRIAVKHITPEEHINI